MSELPPPASDGSWSLIPGSTRARRAALVVLTLAWSFACASPGLFGSWVYDDLRMVDNPCYDGWDDVLALPHRTAADYLLIRTAEQPVARGSETYRPVTMLGLVTTHVIAPVPLPHHLVGWGMHILTAWLLLVSLGATLTRAGLQSGYVPWCLTTVFLLHPVGVETYVWIHGRSDVVAGAFVMMSAVVAMQASTTRRHRLLQHPAALLLAAFLTAAFALGSKETALGAVVAVWASALLWAWQQPRAVRDVKYAWLGAAAAAAGVVAYFVAWYLAQPSGFADAGVDGPPFSDPDTRAFAPKLLAVAVGTMLSLEALPMQSYVWLAFRPLTLLEWGGVAVMLALLAHLAWRRDVRALMLVAGAVLTLLPTVILIRTLWLGRDRYLYMPLLLLLLALAPVVASVLRRTTERLRWLPVLTFAMVVLTASASTFVGSSYYKNQVAWMTSGIQEDAADPTRHVFAADELADNGATAGALAFIEEMPPPPWPLLVSMELINVAYRLNDRELHGRMLAQAERDYPDNPQPRLHRMTERFGAGDIDRGLSMARELAETTYCTEVVRSLRNAAVYPMYNPEEQARIAQAAEQVRCPVAAAD